MQTIQYSAHGKVAAKEVRELAMLRHGKTRGGGTDLWRDELLYVPPLPPTNLRGCHLISVQYDVFVSIVITYTSRHRSCQLSLIELNLLYRDHGSGERAKCPH